MAFNENSKLIDILKNPGASEILDKYVPGFQKHPQLKAVQNFSLRVVAGFPQAGIKPDMLKAIVEDFSKLS